MKAVITIGPSASGKSSWARAHAKLNKNTMIVERDEIRKELFTAKRPSNETFTWRAWNWKWESEVNQVVADRIELAALRCSDLIISDTNLHAGRRAALAERLEKLGYEVEFKNFEVTFFEAVKRDLGRENPVGPWTIAQQVERYVSEFVEPIVYDPSLPNVILVDIDGTVAKMVGRSPFEWEKVGQDEPHEHVWAMISGLVQAGNGVIFLSGRDGVCEPQTLEWLKDQGSRWIPSTPFDLQMRSAGDTRPDTIVKRELFDTHIRGKYNVTVVLDDRPKVAQMWRELGLNVVQIGNPYIDF